MISVRQQDYSFPGLVLYSWGKHWRLKAELGLTLGEVPMQISVPDTQWGSLLHCRKI